MSEVPTHPVHWTSGAIMAAIACGSGDETNAPAAKAAMMIEPVFRLIMVEFT